MIPENHPRYQSLMLRNKMAEGVMQGIVHPTGLIAHGRGEAFDYLLGERTQSFADDAARAAAAYLKIAKKPVISVNGNVAVLVADEIVKLAEETGMKMEVNLFHRSEERIRKIIAFLEEKGGNDILGIEADARIAGLSHDRALCSSEGIYAADVILVPLEDGDRCEALKHMGKVVVTVDLNPLSRTARSADVTVVDNVIRAIPNIREHYTTVDKPDEVVEMWDNKTHLQMALDFICERLRTYYR